MTTLVLPKQPNPRPARELVVATRVPPPPKKRTGNIFADLGDVTARCAHEGCGYNVMGTRANVGAALREHHRLYHPEQVTVVLLNDPSQ